MRKVPDRVRPTITTRLGVSLPTAIGALLFAGVVAFGSGMTGMPSTGATGSSTPGHSPNKDNMPHADKGGDYQGMGGQHPDHDYDKPKPPDAPKPPKPDQQPQPDKPKPEQPQPDKPKPPYETPKPKPPAPAPTTALQLQAQAGIGKVKLTWSKFAGEGFGYYKIVRSTDATVSWPLGAGDTLVGWTSDKYQNWFKDFPPCGTPFWYAVFAVKGDSGYQLLSASNTVTGTAQCETPPPPDPTPEPPAHPDPTAMAFSVSNVDGGVHLDWEQCGGTGFTGYVIVRSMTNPDPTYPLNAGTELVATISNATNSAFVDANVLAGQTWTYRVYSMGADGSGAFTLGFTAAVSVTVN
jgi:hypothetical protein